MKHFIFCCSCFGWESVTAIATAFLALLTFWIVLFARKAAIAAEKALYANTVSNSRPPYIQTLRKAFADLHAALISKKNQEIAKSIPYVLFHFNQYEGVGVDRPFIENCLNKLLDKAINEQDINQGEIDKFRKWSAAILQYEWQGFKDECIKGRKLSVDEKRQNKQDIIDSALVGL